MNIDFINLSFAIQSFLNSKNPYSDGFQIFNPPWVIPILTPFVLFPYGRELFFVVSIAALAWVAYRLGASHLGVIAFALSPLVFDSLIWGNIEGLVLIGLVVNPVIGIILLALKPQMTIAVIAFIIIEYKQSRLKLIAPLVILSLLSVISCGFWFMRLLDYGNVSNINLSLFPWSIPIGIALFAQSLRTHNIRYALAASPMFFPSVSPPVWLVVFLALVSETPKISIASASAWTYILLNKAR